MTVSSTFASRGLVHPIIRHCLQCPPARRIFMPSFRCPPQSFRSCSNRLFTTSKIRLGLAEGRGKPTNTKQTSRVAEVVVPHSRSANAYASELARKANATTLYEGAPQPFFVGSSFLAGVMCWGCAIINFHYNVYNVPDGVSAFVPIAFGAVGLMFAALGFNFALMPASVVRSIKVLPAAVVPGSPSRNSSVSKVYLEVKVRPMSPVPGVPLKTIRAVPDEVVMAAPLWNPISAEQAEAENRKERQRRKAQWEYDREHIMTTPFRHGWRVYKTAWRGIRRGLTGEGFAPLWIDGQRYKLDVQSAYVLDSGRALDRLVKIDSTPKPSPFSLLKKI